LITGESVPEPAGPGTDVYAGAVNLGAPLKLTVRVAGEGTLLAEIARLMEAAEQRRTRYVGMADAVAHWYAPVVHMLALSAFIGWFVFGGLAWQESLMIAIAVLIITCPCALGLAVPVVQVIACSRLMRQGILLKSGSALERLAQIDMVVFDKTGTLTVGRPELVNAVACDSDVLRQAAGIASASLHPLAKALVAAAGPGIKAADGVLEKPGAGLTWNGSVGPHRLGNRSFVGLSPKSVDSFSADVIGPEIWYARPDHEPVCYRFTDALRSDAGAVIRSLEEMGIEVRLLSGDRPGAVSAAAWALGIDNWQAQVSPDGKLRYLEGLRRTGRRPVMVGDGLNDAPALAAAFVSLSPASGADISRTAADIVFQGERLAPILESLKVARTSERLVKQNFLLAFLYNIVTVPIAIAGHVTPLIAAIAMSGSSLIVIGNALRMNWVGGVWTGGGWTKPRWSAKLLPIEPQPVAPCDIERGTQS